MCIRLFALSSFFFSLIIAYFSNRMLSRSLPRAIAPVSTNIAAPPPLSLPPGVKRPPARSNPPPPFVPPPPPPRTSFANSDSSGAIAVCSFDGGHLERTATLPLPIARSTSEAMSTDEEGYDSDAPLPPHAPPAPPGGSYEDDINLAKSPRVVPPPPIARDEDVTEGDRDSFTNEGGSETEEPLSPVARLRVDSEGTPISPRRRRKGSRLFELCDYFNSEASLALVAKKTGKQRSVSTGSVSALLGMRGADHRLQGHYI